MKRVTKGPGPVDNEEGRVYNTVIKWTAGIEYEADPHQAAKLIRELKLD